jgi:hypothetical protein
MSWTHSYQSEEPGQQAPDDELVRAREAFMDAKRAFEEAHEELLRTHGRTVRRLSEKRSLSAS